MAITKVPKIEGYNLPGSVAYGLNLSVNYANSPSKLTLNLVSQDGKYTLPTIRSSHNISFGNFNFKGKVWGYSLKESADQKTLDVEFIDNSIILDQYYVILWKRGLFGYRGTSNNVRKTFNFSDESILVPRKGSGGNPFTKFEEKSLGTQTISRSSRKFAGVTYGNIILLGTEKFADSDCDIPDTYYTFNDLKRLLPVNGNNFPNDNNFRGTHEGTLRSVLSSWCADLGYDFYWNYTNDYLEFYPVTRGITVNIPKNITSNIISRDISVSMDGTFRQYGVTYTIMPKQPLKTLSFSRNYNILYSVSPIPLSYLIRRNGIIQDFDVGNSRWGAKRNEDQFITCAFLGFVSRSLRDFFCIKNKFWRVLGYDENFTIAPSKEKMVNFLNVNGFRDLVTELSKLSDESLSSYDIALVNYDESLADQWNQIEQDLLQSYGKYYRIPDSSGEFFFCNDTYVIEISINVEPEGTSQTFGDGKTVKKIFSRGGQMSHDQASALDELNYDAVTQEINKCAPTHIALKENGLLNKLITAKLLTNDSAKKITHIVIVPKYSQIIEPLLNLSANTSTGINPLEQTWYDQKDSNTQEGRKNCKYYDRLENGSCESAEESARKAAIKAVGGQTGDEENSDNFVSGLTSRGAKSCTITLKTGRLKIYAPSNASYQVVCSYSINANKISTNDTTNEFIWYSTNIPNSRFDDVSEIRITNENVTDPFEDSFRRPRKSETSRPPGTVIANTEQQTVKYVFAGEPQGINLTPQNGLSNLDVSLSSEGFTTSVTLSSRPPQQSKANNTLRLVSSQFNRASFNAS